MSNSIMPNAMNTGVRRLHTLGGWGLGADLAAMDIMQSMMNDGYNSSTLNELITAGATAPMLQNLWDNTAAGSQEFAVAANQLLTNLTGGPGGAASAPGYPTAMVSTAFGLFDLSQQAGWDGIAATLSMVRKLVNQVAAGAPNAPDVVANVGQLNSQIAQFSSYYSQVTGKAPTLSGLGIFGVDDAIILAVIGIVAAVYAIYQWATTRKAQAAATVSAAQAQAALIQSIPPGSTPEQISSILTAGVPQPGSAQNWAAYLQQNMGVIFGVMIGAIVFVKVLKKV